MNDTERDLRALFEAKARDAGSAPPVTGEVLRRGRRRQIGTVAVAGVTAVAVAAVAVVSLQALHRADTRVPGGPNGNPAFTATIQNLTLTVPEGWTLIDQWPLGSIMAVDSTSTKFTCVGTPIEAGSGGNASSGSSSSDCTDQQAQTPEPPTIPEGGLPMLTLSNDDPGLGGSVCNAGGSLPASSATLYIGVDYGATRSAGWENDILPWPQPLVNVLEGDLPPEQMPCGPGGYAYFQTGGVPYVAWAGFGSDASDADRQTIVDTFNGMQVGEAEITPASSEAPGYVLTGGTTDSGTAWTVEVSPSSQNVDMHYSEVGGSAGGGAGDFNVPDVPIEASVGRPVVFGAITFEADRVEVRPADGSDPILGTILQLPGTLGAPFDGFVAPNSPGGEVVAIGPDGDLGSAATTPVGPEPAPTVDDVKSDLRNAYVVARTFFADQKTYEGLDTATARSFGAHITFNMASQAVAGEVSIRDATADHIAFAEATARGDVLCLAVQPDGSTTYGALDAQTAAECVGGEAAWSQAPVGAGGLEPRPAESTVDLQGFSSPARLTVRTDSDNRCLSIEIATGDNEGAGFCSGGPIQPVSAEIVATSVGESAVLGYVSPDTDRVYLVSDDGRRFDATILYTLRVYPKVQFFAFSVPVTSGLLHVTDVNGVELRSPIPLNSAP